MRALSRKTANRKSMLRNLATSLVLYERIKTTTAKAKEVKPMVEHLLSVAKKNDLTARRRLLSFFFDENATKKAFEVLVPRYKDVQSGFIKTYKLGPRLGDAAEMTILELKKVEAPVKETKNKKDNDANTISKEDNETSPKINRKDSSKATGK